MVVKNTTTDRTANIRTRRGCVPIVKEEGIPMIFADGKQRYAGDVNKLDTTTTNASKEMTGDVSNAISLDIYPEIVHMDNKSTSSRCRHKCQ